MPGHARARLVNLLATSCRHPERGPCDSGNPRAPTGNTAGGQILTIACRMLRPCATGGEEMVCGKPCLDPIRSCRSRRDRRRLVHRGRSRQDWVKPRHDRKAHRRTACCFMCLVLGLIRPWWSRPTTRNVPPGRLERTMEMESTASRRAEAAWWRACPGNYSVSTNEPRAACATSALALMNTVTGWRSGWGMRPRSRSMRPVSGSIA